MEEDNEGLMEEVLTNMTDENSDWILGDLNSEKRKAEIQLFEKLKKEKTKI